MYIVPIPTMTGAKKKTFVQKEILDIERNYNFSGATITRDRLYLHRILSKAINMMRCGNHKKF